MEDVHHGAGRAQANPIGCKSMLADAGRLAKPTDILVGKYTPDLVAAVGELKKEQLYGVVAFLDWIATRDPDTLAGRVYRFFHHVSDGNGDELFPAPLDHERAFVDVMQDWHEAYVNGDSKLTRGTRTVRVGAARIALEGLRDRGFRGIPSGFRREFVKAGTPDNGTTPSLGEADWPELEGSQGNDRQRRALELVRAAYVETFLYYERLFDLGQAILNGSAVQGGDEAACEALRRGLLIHRNTIRETGTFKLDIGAWRAVPKDPDLWQRAGGIDISRTWVSDKPVSCAYRSAFGPAMPATMAALGVVLCETGWNHQPARDLPRNPFVFRSAKHVYVGVQPVIDSWKERAGHYVVGSLGESGDLDERIVPTAVERWKETIESCDPDRTGDGYACLDRGPTDSGEISAADILDRYARMADALRSEFGGHADKLLGGSFWVCFTSGNQPRTYRRNFLGVFDRDSILERRGFTHRGIRRTVLILRRLETGSFAAARAMAGHASSRILMPHYLNTPTVNAELDASIAQFQSALEGIVTRDLDQDEVARKLGTTVSELDRMRRVADRAGLSAALGLVHDDEEGDRPSDKLHFRATDERLSELYLLHRALRHMEAHYPNRARFQLDYRPLLALCKAIGRAVFKAHLGPRYWRAARRMSAALKRGVAALPALED